MHFSSLTLSQIYSQHRSDRLADVLLDSFLGDYDQSLAIDLLLAKRAAAAAEPAPPTSSQSSRRAPTRKDSFALALLYLEKGFVAKAAASIRELDTARLAEMAEAYAGLLESSGGNGEGKSVSLGQLLRVCAPWTLADLLVKLEATVPTASAVAVRQNFLFMFV